MPETRLEFNALEARGIFMLQTAVLNAAGQSAQATAMLKAAEDDAAKTLLGRVPAGIGIRQLRIDQQTGEVFAPEA